MEAFGEGSLNFEASNDDRRQRRFLRKDIYTRAPEELYLPILIIPGVASSGLYVKKSSVDEKFEGERLWMNVAFLAKARLNNKVLNENEVEEERAQFSKRISGAFPDNSKLKKIGGAFSNFSDMVKGSIDHIDGEDGKSSHEIRLRKAEAEIAIKNTWIQHIALDTNMIDERPGNEVRTWDGLKGCEYVVDGSLEKMKGHVMAPMVEYCTTVMGYEREKSIDAMPYDWRLAPSINEKRDGYLTRMIERVERMYDENDGLPVVLLCHSMGCKMGHYFLNFSLKEKGQDWLDKYIHTFMPVAAPHGGVGCAVRCGMTGEGLDATVDTLVGNIADGLIMYRSWSCGNWLMPRMLPKGVWPTCIIRREGELGVAILSEIDVTSLFARRDKKPKELRLTVVFRGKIRAHSEFYPVVINKSGNDPDSMTISFQETFYMPVPYIDDNPDEIGELMFHLEEPAGRVYQNKSELGKKLSDATRWARDFKKRASRFAREFAKEWGTVLRVAVCAHPVVLDMQDFIGLERELETTVPFVDCLGQKGTFRTFQYSDFEVEEKHEDGKNSRDESARSSCCSIESIGSISLSISYSPPPDCSGTEPSATPIAMINKNTPNPSIKCKPHKSNIVPENQIKYDVMNGIDVFEADGLVQPMIDLVKNIYEGDPIGPTKESSLHAPPVNCVRSIYGINTHTEVGAVYRKVQIVTIGDNEADCRYEVDTSACFPTKNELFYGDPWCKKNLHSYKLEDGVVFETPDTLQDVPGQTEQRKVCGDGTVPYWNMIHALSWKNKIDELTLDELDGASHRGIVGDKRFFALLKRYCKVIDPRVNAMMMLKNQNESYVGGIGSLGQTMEDSINL